MRRTLSALAIGLTALAAPHAAAQVPGPFIIESAQFGNNRVLTEARTADDFASDGNATSFNFQDDFENIFEQFSRLSELTDSAAYADLLQTGGFNRGERSFTMDAASCLSASGWTDLADGQIRNTADARSEASFVVAFEATQRFELRLRGSLIATTTGLGHAFTQLFVYGPGGIVIADAADSRNEQDVSVVNLDERYVLEPGNYVVELIGFSDVHAWADQVTGVQNSTAISSWVLNGALRALPNLRAHP